MERARNFDLIPSGNMNEDHAHLTINERFSRAQRVTFALACITESVDEAFVLNDLG
jgi:hypothetical protein